MELNENLELQMGLNQNIDWLMISLEGGETSSSENELPDFTRTFKYKIHQLDNNPITLESEFALKNLFPNLPDSDYADPEFFKVEATPLFNQANGQ